MATALAARGWTGYRVSVSEGTTATMVRCRRCTFGWGDLGRIPIARLPVHTCRRVNRTHQRVTIQFAGRAPRVQIVRWARGG
jgi:hypothetical protein